MYRPVLSRLDEARQWRGPLLELSPDQQNRGDVKSDKSTTTETATKSNLSNEPIVPRENKSSEQRLDELIEAENDIERLPPLTKRPFLKKGRCLERYNMKPEDYTKPVPKFKTLKRRHIPSMNSKNKSEPSSSQKGTSSKKAALDVPKPIEEPTDENGTSSDTSNFDIAGPSQPSTSGYKKPSDISSFDIAGLTQPSTSGYRKPSDISSFDIAGPSQPSTSGYRKPSDISSFDIAGLSQPSTSGYKNPNISNDKMLSVSSDDDDDEVQKTGYQPPEPLRMPRVAISCKGKWFTPSDFGENSDSEGFSEPNDFNAIFVPTAWRDAQITAQDTEYNYRYRNNNYSDDEELRVFETLERRVDQSGFCSRDTSIIKLLNGNCSQYLPPQKSPASSVETNRDDCDVIVWDQREDEDFSTISSVPYEVPYGNGRFSTQQDSRSLQLTTTAYESSESTDDSVIPVGNKNCEACPLAVLKIEEYQRALELINISRRRLDETTEEYEIRMQDLEKNEKIRQREIDKMKADLQARQREIEEADPKAPTKAYKALRNELLTAKQEIGVLKIELAECKEYMKVRESNQAMKLATLRAAKRQTDEQNDKLRAEIIELKNANAKLIARGEKASRTNESRLLQKVSKDLNELKNNTLKIVHDAEQKTGSSKGAVKKVTPKKGAAKSLGKIFKNTHSSETTSRNVEEISQQVQAEHGQFDLNESSFQGNMQPSEIPETEVGSQDENAVCENFGEGVIKKIIMYNRSGDKTSSSRVITPGSAQGRDALENLIFDEIFTYTWGDTMLDNSAFPIMTSYNDGSTEFTYANGNIKLITSDGIVRYYYARRNTWQTHLPEGTELFEYPSGHLDSAPIFEVYHLACSDGSNQLKFFEYTVIRYTDGVYTIRNDSTGVSKLFHPSGEVEYHTEEFKRRIYANGTIKTVYINGMEETVYLDGRVRIKNAKGEVIVDEKPH